MNSPLTRLRPVLALGFFVIYGPGCSATRDERLPSERLLSACQTDAQCGADALCQAGICISSESASVTGQVEGAPASVEVSSQKASDDEVCAMHEGQGLVCTVAPGGRVALLAPTVPGYRFVGWTGESCQSDQTTLELDRVERHLVCIAHYVQRLRVSGTVDGAPGLPVQVRSDSPSASCQDDVCEVDENQPVVLEAPPRDGFRPTGFTGAGCGDPALARPRAGFQTGARVTVAPVDSDLSCVAGYTASLTARGQAEGLGRGVTADLVASSAAASALCSGPLCAFDSGADVSLLAPNVDRYRFRGWTGEERCLADAAALALSNLTSSVICSAEYVPRFSVQVVSEGVVAPPLALAASSDSPFASCNGAMCSVDGGQQVSLVAGSVAGYRLASWSGEGCSATSGAAATAANVSADVTCSAHYTPGISVTGTLVHATGEVDARSPSTSASCVHGSCAIAVGGTVTLTAPTLPGRTFLGWSGDDGCTSDARSVTLSDVSTSKNCFATFALRYVALGRSVPEAASTIVASSATSNASCTGASCAVDAASAVLLTIAPNPSYRFTGWSGDALCSGAGPALTLPSVTRNVSCNANFVARVEVSGSVAPAAGGTVLAQQASPSAVCSQATCMVDSGSNVSLTAQAAPGYRFTGWTGCGTPVASATLPVIGATVRTLCTANFERLTFVVSALASAGGSASASSGGTACPNASCSVRFGDSATLRATPDVGYTFASWTGCSGASAQLDLPSVRASQTCTATFSKIRLTVAGISVPAGAGNIVATSAANASCSGGSCTLDYGSDATLTADANPPGYRFDSWSGCVGLIDGRSVSFTGVMTNESCQARYIKRWTVTGSTNDTSQGSTTCATGCAIDQAGAVDLLATPTAGHQLTSWTCSNGAVYGPQSMLTVANVRSDVSCSARFDAIPM